MSRFWTRQGFASFAYGSGQRWDTPDGGSLRGSRRFRPLMTPLPPDRPPLDVTPLSPASGLRYKQCHGRCDGTSIVPDTTSPNSLVKRGIDAHQNTTSHTRRAPLRAAMATQPEHPARSTISASSLSTQPPRLALACSIVPCARP